MCLPLWNNLNIRSFLNWARTSCCTDSRVTRSGQDWSFEVVKRLLENTQNSLGIILVRKLYKMIWKNWRQPLIISVNIHGTLADWNDVVFIEDRNPRGYSWSEKPSQISNLNLLGIAIHWKLWNKSKGLIAQITEKSF